MLARLTATGRVVFHGRTEYLGDRRFESLLSGIRFHSPRARVVDARYLSPDIPSLTPPPFAVDERARVIPVNELVRITHAPERYVIVGAGKTATDTCVWLLRNGVSPNAITWVRPRDPWLLNRAVVQPDPAIFLGMAADTMAAAAHATSADDAFLRMEDAGIMLRIDRAVTPTMAKTPTLATWELDLVRTIDDVIRRGHLRAVAPGRLVFARRRRAHPRRLARRALRRRGPEVSGAAADLDAGGDHAAACAGGLPVLRRSARRLCRSHPRR